MACRPQEKRRHKYALAQKKKANVLMPARRESLEGVKIYAHTGLCTPDSDISQWIRSHNARRTYDKFRGTIFVVSDLKHDAVDCQVKWAAVLRGGKICTPLFVKSGGKKGASIAYKSALSMKRLMWCSDECYRRNQTTIDLIRRCMTTTPDHRWTWLPNREKAVELGVKRSRKGNAAEVILLVTADEQTGCKEPGLKVNHKTVSTSYGD